MTFSLKTSMAVLTFLAGMAGPLCGQATPTATEGDHYEPGPKLPAIDGNFKYSLAATQVVERGGVGNYTQTMGSGTLEYQSKSVTAPFGLLYSGGVSYATFNTLGLQTFQGLTVSQGLIRGLWNFGISDTVSFLPSSPTTGLTGVAGVGNQGVVAAPNPNIPSQAILTTYGKSLSNSVAGDMQRQLTGRTSIDATANYGILRYLDGTGFDSDQIGSQVGLNRKLSERTSVGVNAQYGVYSFTGSTSFNTRGLNVSFTRELSRELSVNGSFGPQWVSQFSSTTFGTSSVVPLIVPARLSLACIVGVNYSHRFTNANVSYMRGVNNGAGIQAGGFINSVSGSVGQTYGQSWGASISASYNNISGLTVNGTTSSEFGTAQITRRLNRDFSVYASATVMHQNLNSVLTGPYLLNGASEMYAIGVTFSPNALHLGQF